MAILNKPNLENAPSIRGRSYFYVLSDLQWYNACKTFASQEIRDKMKYLFANPYEVIRSFRVYPYTIAVTQQYNLRLGFADITAASTDVGQVGRISGFENIIDLGQISVPYRTNSFLDVEPYTTAQLYLPYIGFVTLSMKDILGAFLHVYYVIDYATGTAHSYTVRQRLSVPGADDKILSINEGVIGLEIPILSNNAMSLANQQRIAEKQAGTEAAIYGASTAVSTIAGIVGSIAGFVTGNLTLGIGGLTMALGSTAGGAAKLVQTGVSRANTIAGLESHFGSTGVPGGVSGWYAPQQAILYRTHINTITIGDAKKYYGKPIMGVYALNRLHGYTEIDTIHLKNYAGATQKELDELEMLLRTGVHFPD